MILSPVRLNKRTSPVPTRINTLNPEDQRFNGAAHHFADCPPNTEDQTSFSDSWPSIDLGSSPANTPASLNKDTLTRDPTSGVWKGEPQDSVLAKYIERFRHGRPQSREERQQMWTIVGEGQQPFWWLSSSPLPPCSTPTQTTDKGFSVRNNTATPLSPIGQFRYDAASSPCTGLLDLSAMELSDSSHCDLGDADLLQLQKKASKLLHQSEQSLSSGSIPISSEGLGCSDFSFPVSIEEPVRRPLVSSLVSSTTEMGNLSSSDIYTGTTTKPLVLDPQAPRTRPEEDILFQWRLRRKIELARQWSQSNPHQPSVNREAWKVQQNPLPDRSRGTPSYTPDPQETSAPGGLFPPATAPVPPLLISSHMVSKLQPNTTVPSHMHLLCDVLPCPTHSPLHSHKRSQNRRDVPGADRTLQKPNAQTRSGDTSSSKLGSSAASSRSEATEDEGSVQQRRTERTKKTLQKKEVDRSEKRTGPSNRNKKSARHNVGDGVLPERQRSVSRHDNRGSDRVTQWREEPDRDVGEQDRRPVSEGRPGDGAPPPSPIHSALGQVISEVLFPTTGSPDLSKSPVSLDSPGYTRPVTPGPPSHVQPPREVVAQLLQEAEDSDERDFEEDPLLHVLRQQRKWVKEQISEVNSLLNELQEA